jgi:amino-acid N-acetyltransferase
MIRKAINRDVPQIQELLNRYGKQGLLLSRSLSELYTHLRDFWVKEEEDNYLLSGICALEICWDGLGEIRSLAVRDSYQGKGIGSELVKRCLDEAISIGLKKVFALTYIPDFFIKKGFTLVDKSVLPHKVWAHCLKCPKFPQCDEHAVMIEF